MEIPNPTLELIGPRPGLITPVRRDRTGSTGPTIPQTRGKRWRRTSQGFYVPAGVERTTSQRVLEAAVVLPGHGGVTGWAALHWMGGRWFDGLDESMAERDICVVTSCDDIRSQPGIRVSAERLDPRDLLHVDQVRVTSAVRAVCFEMRYAASVRAAVLVVDMAAYSDLVSVDEVESFITTTLSGWTGAPQARAATLLADENFWSPTEATAGLVWEIDCGLPKPLSNRPVFDLNGRHVGTPDLLDVEAGMVGEYDGALHLAGSRRAKDIDRDEKYRAVGLECITMVSRDLQLRRPLVDRIHATRGRALWLPEHARRWTLTQPHWWVDTSTVARRRALTAEERKTWLGYRAAA